jgi:8-oxo-dGTP diphosphatase
VDSDHAGPDDARPIVPCVGAVVQDDAGRLLLVRRGREPSRGLWSLPGGRVEPGETPAEAVVREVREETGLLVRAGEPVGSVRIPAEDVVYDVLDLRCVLTDATSAPAAGDDADDALFADEPTLSTLPCTPRLVETLVAWGVLPHRALPTGAAQRGAGSGRPGCSPPRASP